MQDDVAELAPGLVLVHGNRAEQLRDVLLAWMRHQPLAPLENEYLLVQSNGIAQWLRLALAQDSANGVAAALDFLLPSRFMWQAYRSVLGDALVPEDSPLDKDALVWRLMRLLPTLLDQPAYAVLRQFLAGDDDARKRYQLAGRLADLFDQYQVYRADWLQAWAAGQVGLPDERGILQDMPPNQAWQAHLWRDLLDDLQADASDGAAGPGRLTGSDGFGTSAKSDEAGRLSSLPARPVVGRAAIHKAFMARVSAHPADAKPGGLPRRILVFGVSAMPRQTFEALAALSRWVQILVCVHNPCAHYWADIQGDRDVLRAQFRRQARRPGMPEMLDEADLHQQTHPLLAAWGRQGRDYIGLLDEFDDPSLRSPWARQLAALHQRIDAFETLPGANLLQQLQEDIRDLRPVAETRTQWPPVDPLQDDSIRFQVAHSPQREVEILQDQLLAAFQADPSLQPRDVIVMVPDIEAYAPHIQAVFGLYGKRDARHIPYTLADRSVRQADPLVIVLEQLLTLPQQRLGINEVLEWLAVPALRQRFNIDADDLPILQAWARESHIRWGLHADHRASFQLDQAPEAAHGHTWQFGLQRMLLGYAVGQDAPAWQGIEPYAEPSGLQAAALGGLASLLDTLDHYWRVLSQAATPAQWGALLQALLDDFFLVQADQAVPLNQFRERLQSWLQYCDIAGLTEPLPSAIVVEHCLASLDQGGLSQRFFAGSVTFATLMPMRAIPFRHVCLLGMHDGAFPRVRPPSDMDLMALKPRSGDRSRREDDRYLFLEALLSARDRLSISWVGHSILDHAAQPPSVLVAQLRDHLDRGWQPADGKESLAEALTCHHPLQPFSVRYFPLQPDPGPQGLFTYAAEWRMAHGAPSVARSLADLSPLAPADTPLTLRDLAAFLHKPVQTFYQQRLQIYFYETERAFIDGEPYVHDGLEQWQLNDELLSVVSLALAHLPAEEPAPDALQAVVDHAVRHHLDRLQRGGALMSGGLGQISRQNLVALLQKPLQDYIQACQAWPVCVAEPRLLAAEITDPWGGEWRFQDRLSGWRQNAENESCRLVLQASHLLGKDNHYQFRNLIRPWVEHVAAHALGLRLSTLLFTPKGMQVFKPLPQDEAQALWQTWWQAYFQGLCQPLPMDIGAAGAWLRSGGQPDAAQEHVKAQEAAADAYDKSLSYDPYLARSYPDFQALRADHRFYALADRWYGGLNQQLSTKKSTKKDAA